MTNFFDSVLGYIVTSYRLPRHSHSSRKRIPPVTLPYICVRLLTCCGHKRSTRSRSIIYWSCSMKPSPQTAYFTEMNIKASCYLLLTNAYLQHTDGLITYFIIKTWYDCFFLSTVDFVFAITSRIVLSWQNLFFLFLIATAKFLAVLLTLYRYEREYERWYILKISTMCNEWSLQ